MPEKIITITIDERGNSTFDLDGFVGNECERAFEEFRGGDSVKLERKKPTYYANRQAEEQKSQR